MKYILLLFLLLGCQKSSEVVKKPGEKSNTCLQFGNKMVSPFDVAYCALSDGRRILQGETFTGYKKNIALTPITCGPLIEATCEMGGVPSEELHSTCTQLCLLPEQGTPVPQGFSISYYLRPSGTQADCLKAYRQKKCLPSGEFETLDAERFGHCAVINGDIGTVSYWSEKKLSGKKIVVPKDDTIILDVSPAPIEELEVRGALIFDNRDLILQTRKIINSGAIRIGSPDVPFTKNATIVLLKAKSPEEQQFISEGGRLLLFGNPTDRSLFEESKLPEKLKGRGIKPLPYENWGIPLSSNIFILKE